MYGLYTSIDFTKIKLNGNYLTLIRSFVTKSIPSEIIIINTNKLIYYNHVATFLYLFFSFNFSEKFI